MIIQIGAIDGEDDCTHFISCCVGQGLGTIQVGDRQIEFPGGGISILSPFAANGVYGET